MDDETLQENVQCLGILSMRTLPMTVDQFYLVRCMLVVIFGPNVAQPNVQSGPSSRKDQWLTCGCFVTYVGHAHITCSANDSSHIMSTQPTTKCTLSFSCNRSTLQCAMKTATDNQRCDHARSVGWFQIVD